MSISINQVNIAGNLTRDIDVKYSQSGTAIGNTAVAVNERRKVGGEWKDDVLFLDVTFFGKLAERCAKHLAKGDTVHVAGRLQCDKWEAEDGTHRKKYVVIANDCTFIRWGRDRQEGQPDTEASQPPF
jgi:single-strand DNA-binding protein